MKFKNILTLMLIFTATLCTQSCSDDDSGNVATDLVVTMDTTKVESITFASTPAYRLIGIHSDGDWAVSVPTSDSAWIHITPHSGYGHAVYKAENDSLNTYVRINVDRNDGTDRTSTVTVVAGAFTKVINVTQKGIAANDPFNSANDFVDKAVLGYNLGNTLDADPGNPQWWLDKLAACTTSADSIKAYETSWGQPVTTQKIIDDITAKGFNVIRVPVTWEAHLDANNKIDKAWMDRVQEVVDYVIKDSCYCIINVMHDTGSKGDDPSTAGNKAWLYADIDAYPTQTVKYQAIWQQIAERFKDYDEHLVFESFNEILNKSYSWTVPTDVNDGAYQAINKLQQDFVNTVRATGGNNTYRNLGITTYAATANSDVAVNALEVPTDPTTGHIYATFHSYDPYNFCNSNKCTKDGVAYDYNIYSWDSSCETSIDEIFTRVNTRCNTLGIPYIFGEFGAIDENKDMNERVKYASYLGSKFKTYNTTGLWWMGLYNRSTNTWSEERIVNAPLNAVK